MTRISALTATMITVAGAALAQSNPNPGAVPNTGVSPFGPTYTTPGNQGGASPSVGGGTSTGPTFTTPPPSMPPPPASTSKDRSPSKSTRAPPNSAPVPPNSNSGHPPDETEGLGAAPSR
jgi:hypothetical protein